MKHITTIEGLSLDEFDAWLRRDWSIYIFPPDEWHGHLLDTPAPVKMKTHPKTPIEAGYTFTQQIGADQVKQVGWVYVAKIAKGIKIESDMQPPHNRNFAEWIDWRLGRSAQPAEEAQTAETTPEDSKPGNPGRRAHTNAIRRLQDGQQKQPNRQQWATEYESETGTHPEATKTGEAELYRLKVWLPYRKQTKN